MKSWGSESAEEDGSKDRQRQAVNTKHMAIQAAAAAPPPWQHMLLRLRCGDVVT